MIADHGDFTSRPADAERARDAEELAARDQRRAAWQAHQQQAAAQRDSARRALGGHAHAKAMQIAAEAARRAAARQREERLAQAAEQTAAAERRPQAPAAGLALMSIVDSMPRAGGGAEQNFARQPPQDCTAEQSVLGAMLLSQHAATDVIERLHVDDF